VLSFKSECGLIGVGIATMLAAASMATAQIDCSGGAANPSIVDNGAFSVEFVGTIEQGSYITFTYTVCQLDNGAQHQPSLSHWVLGLGQIDCFAAGFSISDLVVAATIDGEPWGFEVNTDPTTGVTGAKWDVSFDDRGCHDYSVTFDRSVLAPNFTLAAGTAQMATKAGLQVAYACGIGPVCEDPPGEVCWQDATAWSAGSRYTPRGSWATYTGFGGEPKSVTLFAGQSMPAGTVTFTVASAGMVRVCIDLADGFRFDPDTEASVKVQEYATTPPSGNPTPGLFAHHFDAQTGPFCLEVPQGAFYGVHVDVERTVPCAD